MKRIARLGGSWQATRLHDLACPASCSFARPVLFEETIFTLSPCAAKFWENHNTRRGRTRGGPNDVDTKVQGQLSLALTRPDLPHWQVQVYKAEPLLLPSPSPLRSSSLLPPPTKFNL